MNSQQILTRNLSQLAQGRHYLFSSGDLAALLPDLSPGALHSLLSRAQRSGHIQRVSRGLYLNPLAGFPAGLVLYHTAARLRAHEFNYLSLESVLSDAGAISQVPLNWITLMSSGRTSTIDCGSFGHIEFIHTKKDLETLAPQLTYDQAIRLWRASVPLAARDMKDARRDTDLVDWTVVDELV